MLITRMRRLLVNMPPKETTMLLQDIRTRPTYTTSKPEFTLRMLTHTAMLLIPLAVLTPQRYRLLTILASKLVNRLKLLASPGTSGSTVGPFP